MTKELLTRAQASSAELQEWMRTDPDLDPDEDRLLCRAWTVIDELIQEIDQTQIAEETRERSEVWLYAWTAAIASPAMANTIEIDHANRWADECVTAFEERFRARK